MKVRNAFTFATDGNRGAEICNPFSITVPDQALSLRELLDRHQNGGQVVQYKPTYLGENPDIPDGFEKMSKIERAEMAKGLADFVKDARGKLLSRREAEKRAADEQRVIAAYEAKKATQAPTIPFGPYDIPPGYSGFVETSDPEKKRRRHSEA